MEMLFQWDREKGCVWYAGYAMAVDYQRGQGRKGADVEQTLGACVHTLDVSFLDLTGGKLMFSDFGQGEGVQGSAKMQTLLEGGTNQKQGVRGQMVEII